ncbi:MAG: hypothetical protein V4687_07120 [Bacteroidota bacterium]
MDTNIVNYKDIPGWGMDADPENEPTYPMKHYTGDDHNRFLYEKSEQQPETVEMLKSNERPEMTRVFGTTVPPSGLSGMIRRYAFKHSEDRYRHWIPLILADRVNVVEGLIDDLKKGYVPNLVKERGWKMELKHNPKGVAIKVATLAATALVLYTLFKKRK